MNELHELRLTSNHYMNELIYVSDVCYLLDCIIMHLSRQFNNPIHGINNVFNN